jgi:hypothetical protein
MAPIKVTPHTEFKTRRSDTNWKFKVGETVRISKTEVAFTKGYEGGWSKEVFTIKRRLPTDPATYELCDYSGDDIKGRFYNEELQRVVRDPTLFEVEKVVRTRTRNGKKEYLVRWMGYGPKNDSWVDEIAM